LTYANYSATKFPINGYIPILFKSEEIAWYLGIIFAAIALISLNLIIDTPDTLKDNSTGSIIQISFFHVASIITTTGFTTSNIDAWPLFSKTIIILIMFVGACAGSTGGGIKVSRIAILAKNAKRSIKKLLHPRSVTNIRFEGEIVEEKVVSETLNYFIVIMVIFVVGLLILSLDPIVNSFETSVSAMAACLNNIGPGFGSVSASFGGLNVLSKITLIFAMLIGRLEIFPILILQFRRGHIQDRNL
jgi:trk system potassium uptake protein TrkH